jgi:DNA polymerase
MKEALRRHYLQRMGMPVWLSQGSEDRAETPPPRQPLADTPRTDPPAGEQLSALRARVSQCEACELAHTRTQTVFGVGNDRAQWLVIGEAPGADEDRQGEPFVGRAGKLLTSMLRAMGLRREDVYIANILKCRPPGNRDPRPEEVAACEGYLRQQVELIQPRIILAVGRVAAQNLLKTDVALARMRGRTFSYGERQIPVVVTYHPAYLLRSPLDKRKAWQDLCYAMNVLRTSTAAAD